ncbi:hypothetical protein BDZ88DRAFT_104315 [Geranomyces variabilis]|nr:hypothetical protein BDZ88DRAFT_104315 [Geranomyces variabilis]KAJ3141084.1 hypothetical protein HDU90_007108 [Geranomyces variabilis]
MEHRESATDSSLLWEAKVPQQEPKRLSLLIDSYYDDSWSTAPTEQDTVDEHLNLSYLLEAEFCCYQEEHAESEAEPLSNGMEQASVERFLELRHLLGGEFGIPSPAASDYDANSFFAAGNLGGRPLADGGSTAETYIKPQDIVDEHLNLSYTLEDDFRRARDASPPPTPQDAPVASSELTTSLHLEPSYKNETDAALQNANEGLDNQADIDAHFTLYYMLDPQGLVQATASSEQQRPSISVGQTENHAHLALSYQLEEAFRDQPQADAVARSLSDEQATIDAHLALSYLLEAAFREKLQSDAAAGLTSNEQAAVNAHYELSYALEAEFRDQCQAESAARAATEEQAVIDAHYALSYELEAQFCNQLQANDTARSASDVQTTNDADLALSYQLEADFRIQPQADPAPRSKSYAQTIIDAHYALSYELEGEFVARLQADAVAHLASDEQAIIEAHYALSYALEAEFVAQLQADATAGLASDTQAIINAHYALSYELEAEFKAQLKADNTARSASDVQAVISELAVESHDQLQPTVFSRSASHEQLVPNAFFTLSSEPEDAFEARLQAVSAVQLDSSDQTSLDKCCSDSKDKVRRLDSGYLESESFQWSEEQAIVNAHLALSYSLEAEFQSQLAALCTKSAPIEREGVDAAASRSRGVTALEPVLADDKTMPGPQERADSHYVPNDALVAGLRLVPSVNCPTPVAPANMDLGARDADSHTSSTFNPAASEVTNYQHDVDQHLHLSYAYESAFLRESLRSASSPALAEVANCQRDVDQHLHLSYAYESAFLRESLRSASSPALAEVANCQHDVDQHLLLSYAQESAFLRESLRSASNPAPSKAANCQHDVDQHLLLSYAYESAFLRESLRLEERSATVRAHQREPSQEDDLWTLYASEDVHQRNGSCSSSASSGSSTTATNPKDADPGHGNAKEEDEIKPFVQSWTEEVQHLSTLASSLRGGRGRAAWKAYLAIPASDESIIIMRNHLAQKWGTKPRAEWVDELISIMEDELTGLRDNKPVATDTIPEPSSAPQQADYPEKEELIAQAEQLKQILSQTEAVKNLVSVLGFAKSRQQPVAPPARQYDELTSALSILLSQAPGLANSLQDTRKRLAARDEYLASTVASSARDMNGLQETVTELRAANQELTEELRAERAGRRCVERELVRLERARATKPNPASRRVDASPVDSSNLATIMSEFKKMSARVEALERELQDVVGASPSAESRPHHRPRIFIPASVNMTDKLESPTPPASPPHRMTVSDIKTPSAYS